MAKISLVALIFISTIQCSFAQDGRYAIFFSDKAGTPYNAGNPIQFLSQKSIERRIKNDVTITEEDFPVNSGYVSQLIGLGAEVLYTSRWMNCAVVQLEGTELTNVLSLPFVSSAEYVSPIKPSVGGRIKRVKENKGSKSGEANQVQNAMLGLDDMHSDNVFGAGVTIAVFDSGFIGVDVTNPFKSLFLENRLQYTLDVIGKSNNVFQYDGHGSEVLSVMAASLDGTYIGGAPKATYQLYVTEDVDTEFRIEEYNWLYAAEKADSAGADIINTSLGYNLFDDASMDYSTSQLDGNTAVISKAALKATAKGILVIVSAGNDGNTSWKLVNPPADVNGVLAVGSVTSSENLSAFSSIGPTSDGRIKPDVVALGASTSVIKVNGTIGFTSGTSVSTPLVTSLAAGLIQIFQELSASELYNLIIASGNNSDSPNNSKGFGIPHFATAKMILNGEEPSVASSTIYMYPNPAGDILKIELGMPSGQLATVFIYDLKGKMVLKSAGTVTYVNYPIELDVSELAAGIYIIRVESDGLLKTIRLVKH